MKYFITTVLLILSFFTARSQNCGQVLNFVANITNHGNGTSTYEFLVTIAATSGGSKSVLLNISCPDHVFVLNQCEASLATVRLVTYGPFTVTNCTGPVLLNWTGHTNAVCGGTSCASALEQSSLPVELSDFRSSKKDKQVVLEWVTLSEQNNERFHIERSSDGIRFEPLHDIPGAGTTQTPQLYEWIDKSPLSGVNYYRLRQIDFDGQFTFSPVISIAFDLATRVRLYPTITTGSMTLEGDEPADRSVDIYNLVGELVYSAFYPSASRHSIDVSHLPKGMYTANIQLGRESVTYRFYKEQ